jgi:pSer/pThr/pTyr-binding forkhead associated (FHA) protein
VELTWPWGKERLTKPLRIGREPPAPERLIEAINAHGYDNISRSHAELLPDAVKGGVSVIDFGSANGTFVDGTRISSNKPTPLKSGAVVRFAANLAVSVAFTRA